MITNDLDTSLDKNLNIYNEFVLDCVKKIQNIRFKLKFKDYDNKITDILLSDIKNTLELILPTIVKIPKMEKKNSMYKYKKFLENKIYDFDKIIKEKDRTMMKKLIINHDNINFDYLCENIYKKLRPSDGEFYFMNINAYMSYVYTIIMKFTDPQNGKIKDDITNNGYSTKLIICGVFINILLVCIIYQIELYNGFFFNF